MSCRKCGYRFLWQLKEGENKNRCPVCARRWGWNDDQDDKMSAVDARRWYWQRKTRPESVTHPSRLDVVSSSPDIAQGAGEPQIYKLSSSFKLPDAPDTQSTGWRPWSRIATRPVAAPCAGSPSSSVRDTFSRDYSRSYTRTYAMPYNTDGGEFAYATGYSGRKDVRHYTAPGSSREVLEREGRDYKSRLDVPLRVKSYNKKVVQRQA